MLNLMDIASDTSYELPTAVVKRALDNYTWDAWADGVMRTSPLMERWAMLCLDLKARGQQMVLRSELDIELAGEVDRWKNHVRTL